MVEKIQDYNLGDRNQEKKQKQPPPSHVGHTSHNLGENTSVKPTAARAKGSQTPPTHQLHMEDRQQVL